MYLFDLGGVLRTLYNLILTWADMITQFWNWFQTPVNLGFDIPLIGFVGIDFIPLNLLGIGILTLVFFWLIKALVPVL